MPALVSLTQFLERRFEEGLVLGSLSPPQGRQAIESDIDAHRRRSFHRDRIRQFDLNGDKPPLRCFGDPRPRYLTVKAELLGHIHPAELRDPDAVISEFKLIIGEIEARFAALLALELRAASTPFKKGGKRLA